MDRVSEYFTDPRVAEVFAQYDARHKAELEATRELPTGSFGARRDEFLPVALGVLRKDLGHARVGEELAHAIHGPVIATVLAGR